ncbi:MAG: hypothetical protein CO113_00395 [Elusimicrobia bacterium CG_4_9_14_3_um_filter_62_55]|nr:MAG: hypothetical protein COR54_13595 [Elusimicrobia bacterium CG22_combo_CG10-13_8_21_14_all_63_91]PJA14115.1 MAG: hypothetical protein COX66_13445 [Elusimicrobia bacterium CG_4_10_14_0_2_um_filter_63_34]PJB27071.1 MAG: hypothetical protein CO113_00395 [Elusimicrobia bacterium CG_4_9_14_3_um_filter_62_55]
MIATLGLISFLAAVFAMPAPVFASDLLPDSAGAPVVDTGSELPFNRNATPVSEHDLQLLKARGYRFTEQGGLFAPGSGEAVSMNDFFYVIEEVRSRQRLQALLRIQLIQSRNGYRKELPAADREEMRTIARENWHLLTHRTREDLGVLFSGKELFELKQSPATSPIAAPAPPIEVEDIPDSVPAQRAMETLAAAVAPAATVPPPALKAPPKHKPRKPVAPKPLAAVYPAPPPGWNATSAGTIKPLPPPWSPDPGLSVKPLPAPWKRFKPTKEKPRPADPVPPIRALPAPWNDETPSATSPPAAAAASSAAGELPEQDPLPEDDSLTPAERAMRQTMRDLQTAPQQTSGFRVDAAPPPPVAVAKGMTPVVPPPILPPRPPRPEPVREVVVAYPEIDDAAFAKFIESAPYTERVKPLLKLIAKHVREPERRAAIGILTTSMPHIVVDSRKAGEEARASIGRIERGASFARTQIALHDGPVIVSRRSLFSGKRIFLMPDDSAYYAARGMALPAEEAYSRESASVREIGGGWGRTRLYADGSSRLKRSEAALAGALLNALMRVDGDLRGWADDFHSRLRAEAVEFRFYRSIQADSDEEPELDRELASRYRDWFHRPEDYLDMQLDSFFRRSRTEEIAMLKEAGVEGAGAETETPEIRLPPSDSPAKRAWLNSDELARGDR